MNISIITTAQIMLFIVSFGQASEVQTIDCQTIAEGICQRRHKKDQDECVSAKKTKCLADGFFKVNDDIEIHHLTRLLNCFERDEVETICVYFHGSNAPCINYDFLVKVMYCFY